MAILIFAEPVYQYWFTHQPQDFSKESRKLDSLLATMKWEAKDSIVTIPKSLTAFYFNPNQISADSLTLLGLNPILAKRIVNYRNKGGKFYSIKDLKKMYGMDSAWLQKIQPYIVLPTLSKIKKENTSPAQPKITAVIDLNLADTTQLKTIYGIGSKLSARIVAYRNKLGGFISVNQLKEVYGLDSVVINEVKKKFQVTPNFHPIQINLNTTNETELAKHPYIKTKLAQTIIAFRHQHGAFKQVDDLKQITILKDEAFEKIKPYLSANP
jgi:competence ComEA-like helix-hairpin-helix protein